MGPVHSGPTHSRDLGRYDQCGLKQSHESSVLDMWRTNRLLFWRGWWAVLVEIVQTNRESSCRLKSFHVVSISATPMKSDEHPFGALAPRDAHKRGLHRTMTLGGEYATRNYTVKHLKDLKGKTILTETCSSLSSTHKTVSKPLRDGAGDPGRASQRFPGLYRRCQKRHVPRPRTHRQRLGRTDQSVPVRSGW